MSDMEQQPRRAVVVTSFVLVALVCLAILEVGARAVYLARDQLWPPEPVLDPYEQLDPDGPGRYVLRPGYSMTLAQMIEEKRRLGAVLAVSRYQERAVRLGIDPGDVILHINSDGFRGPELRDSREGPRILALGNSCTFGTIEWYTYSRVLERELRRHGIDAEVVNGGVEGYKASDLLRRVEEYKSLRPDVTVIYIGWNGLFDPMEGVHAGLTPKSPSYAVRLVLGAVERLREGDAREAALAAYHKEKRPDRGAPEMDRLDRYVPSFLGDVEQVVEEMQSVGSRVVLVTLPGLYTMDEAPSARALRMGHLPVFTDNPYVLAKMTERYNAGLRALARERGVELIDLARWSDRVLQPRDQYFFDSVHLEEEGQAMIGELMAAEVLPYLEEPPKHAGRAR